VDGADPHIWLSPRNMARMGTNCCRALQSILPARQAELDASLVRLSDDLNDLQNKLEKRLAPVKNGTFWVYHPSWAYFAQAFQLRQQAVEAEGREPSARQLARLIGEAKQTRARVLFADPQYDPRPIQALARQIDAQVITLDPLAEDWPANLLRVAEAIGKALGQSSDEQP
jgi:zinc transport system substrate-binding protein